MSGEDLQPLTNAKKRKSKDDLSDSPKKRVKNSDLEQPAFSQHPSFWAEDGSVLIQIDGVRMKLHRSRLKANSMWFQKLFDGETSDGLDFPVEHDDSGVTLYYLDMAGVRLYDFEVLLEAIENGLEFSMKTPTFSSTAALIRAASTLRFSKVLKYAEPILETVFSARLFPPLSLKEAIEAIELGRRYSYPHILKRGFYELARTSEHFRDFVNNGEGTASKGSPTILEKLSVADFAILLDLQKALFRDWISLTDLPPIQCKQLLGRCPSSDPIRNREIVHGTGLFQQWQTDPMMGLCKLGDVDWNGEGYCHNCRVERIQWVGAQRTKLWVEKMNMWLNIPASLPS